MRHITNEGLFLIKTFEGFKPKPYICPAGYKTVGFGHVIIGSEVNLNANNEITVEQAHALLTSDVVKSEKSVIRLIRVPLSDGQFDALVSFVFNLGGGALQCSTLRSRLNRGEYEGAADQFPRWILVKGVRSRGLLRRRLAEQRLFLEGVI